MDRKSFNNSIRMWIDGKCYNIRKMEKPNLSWRKQNLPKVESLEKQKQTLFSLKFHLPSMYYVNLDRFRDPHIEKVESDTNTTICYPKNGQDGCLEISGDSEESIEEAREKILSFIANIRNQTAALQFISIPLLSDEIKHNFEEFKNKILSENYQGVEESIFQSALRLHLTIVVFSLLNDEEKQEAIRVLEECKDQILKRTSNNPTPLKIKVQGLNCMNNNLSKVNVLYANATFSENSQTERTLQEIADSISKFFYERGLAKEYQENVKLHMTLMNTKYRNKKGSSPSRWVKRETFDATEIIEKYKDYYFGEANFDTVYLSLMTSKGEDGFYKPLATIKI